MEIFGLWLSDSVHIISQIEGSSMALWIEGAPYVKWPGKSQSGLTPKSLITYKAGLSYASG